MKHQQHFCNKLSIYREALSNFDVKGMNVLEIGAGHGELSGLILEKEPKKLVSFEIEPGLCQLKSANFELREQDFTSVDNKEFQNYLLISAPPYSLLPLIEKIISICQIKRFLLLVSEKHRDRFPNAKIVAEMNGEDFTPASQGKHIFLCLQE